MHPITQILLVLSVVALLMLAKPCQADGVKYCRDARTGEIITVGAGMPCPFPTHEI